MPQPVRTFGPPMPPGGGMMPPPPGGMPPGPGMQAPPMAGTLPAPTQNQQQPMGASAPRRKRFGSFLENTLASYQPRPQPPAADQMSGMNMFASPMAMNQQMQRPMPRPQVPSLPRPLTGMRTPGARPLAEGGIVQGFDGGGLATLNPVEKILVDKYGWTDNGDGTLTSKSGKRYDHDAGSTWSERTSFEDTTPQPVSTSTLAQTTDLPVSSAPSSTSSTATTSSTSATTASDPVSSFEEVYNRSKNNGGVPDLAIKAYERDGTVIGGYTKVIEEYKKSKAAGATGSTGSTGSASGASAAGLGSESMAASKGVTYGDDVSSSISSSPGGALAQKASSSQSAVSSSAPAAQSISSNQPASISGTYDLEEAPEGYEYAEVTRSVSPNDILNLLESGGGYDRVYDIDGDGQITQSDVDTALEQSKSAIGDAIPTFLEDIKNYQDSSVYTGLQEQLEELQKQATSSTQAQEELNKLQEQYGDIFSDDVSLSDYMSSLRDQGLIDEDTYYNTGQAESFKSWADKNNKDGMGLVAEYEILGTGPGYTLIGNDAYKERVFTDRDAFNKYVKDPDRTDISSFGPQTVEERLAGLNEVNADQRKYLDMIYGEDGFFSEFEKLKGQVGEYETLAGLSEESQKAVQDMLNQIGEYEGERKELFDQAFQNYIAENKLQLTDYELRQLEDQGEVIPDYDPDTEYLYRDPVTGEYRVGQQVFEGGDDLTGSVNVREVINEGGGDSVSVNPNITVDEAYNSMGAGDAVNVHAPGVVKINKVNEDGSITKENAYIPGITIPRADSFVPSTPSAGALYGPGSYRGMSFNMPEPGTDIFASPIGQISLPSRPSNIDVGASLAQQPAYGSAQAIQSQDILTDVVDDQNPYSITPIEDLDLNLFKDDPQQLMSILQNQQFDLGEPINMFAEGGAVQNYAAGGGVMQQAKDSSGNPVPGMFVMKYDDGTYSEPGNVFETDKLRRASLAGDPPPENRVSGEVSSAMAESKIYKTTDNATVMDANLGREDEERFGTDYVTVRFDDGTRLRTQKGLVDAFDKMGALNDMSSASDFTDYQKDWSAKSASDPVFKESHDFFNQTQIAYDNALRETNPDYYNANRNLMTNYANALAGNNQPAASQPAASSGGSPAASQPVVSAQSVPGLGFASNAYNSGIGNISAPSMMGGNIGIPGSMPFGSPENRSLFNLNAINSLSENNPIDAYAGSGNLSDILSLQARGYKDGGAVPRNTMIGDQPHMLAYINPAERNLLEGLGGTGEPGPGGIPAYRNLDADLGIGMSDKTVTAEDLASGENLVVSKTPGGGSVIVSEGSDKAEILDDDYGQGAAKILGIGDYKPYGIGVSSPSVVVPAPTPAEPVGIAASPPPPQNLDALVVPPEEKTTSPMSIEDRVDALSLQNKTIDEIAEETGISPFEVSEIISDLNAKNVDNAINLQKNEELTDTETATPQPMQVEVTPQTTPATTPATPATTPATSTETPEEEKTFSEKLNDFAEKLIGAAIYTGTGGLIDPNDLNLSGPPTEATRRRQEEMLRRFREGSDDGGSSMIDVNYTMEGGIPVCNDAGYIFDPAVGMCVPVKSQTTIIPSDPYGSGARKGNFDALQGSPGVKPLPMNRGGSVGLNRAADDYLKAMAG